MGNESHFVALMAEYGRTLHHLGCIDIRYPTARLNPVPSPADTSRSGSVNWHKSIFGTCLGSCSLE